MKEIIYENIKFHITEYEGYYVSECGKYYQLEVKIKKLKMHQV
jgi:hypothetical protein